MGAKDACFTAFRIAFWAFTALNEWALLALHRVHRIATLREVWEARCKHICGREIRRPD